MKIYSPSYKRADGVKTHKLIPDIIYCVAEFEAQEYIDRGYNVETMPNEVNGNIARVRNYIVDNYIKDKGIMIDDDIEAFKFWSIKENKPTQILIEDLHEFIENGFTNTSLTHYS